MRVCWLDLTVTVCKSSGLQPMTNTASQPSVRDLARMIDHSLLHPTLTDTQFDAGCALAARFGVATVCVKPCDVPRAVQRLKGTAVLVCSVIGFPHGNSHTSIKILETELALREGAREIDMVAHAGKVLGGNLDCVTDDIRQVNAACIAQGAILKVIFENDFLQDAHIIQLCEICTKTGVAFVKTSTGYGFVKLPNGDYNYKGATEHHLKLMRAHCGPAVQIKAAGGIRTLDEMLRARALGVSRIGASATEAMLTEAVQRGFPGAAGVDLGGAPSRPAASAGY